MPLTAANGLLVTYMPLVYLCLFVGMVGAAVLGWYLNQKREKAFAGFAQANGMEWRNGHDSSMLGLPFHFLQQGDGRGVDDVIVGSWKGLPVDTAHYWYYELQRYRDKNGYEHTRRVYHHFTVVAAAYALQLPYVGIHQQNLFTQAAKLIGITGLQFESEEFNKHFKVDAQDQPFAYKLIDPRMMEWLLGPGRTLNFAVQGGYLLMVTHRLSDPEKLVPLFDTAKGFVDKIPALVWQEYGTQPPTVNAQAS